MVKREALVHASEQLEVPAGFICERSVLQDLLYRRSRSLVDYENANKALDKARAKNKDVLQAETSQQLCCQKFEKISESAKQGTVDMHSVRAARCDGVMLILVFPFTELIDFKTRRVAAFRKNLVELAELELKHAKVVSLNI